MLLAAAARCGAQDLTAVAVTIANESDRDLRCLLVFGHWVTMNVPVVEPGGQAVVELQRAADRALAVPRDQDGRPMMREALHCGYDFAWSKSLVKLGWQAVMLSDRREFVLACRAGERPLWLWR
ncbi:MAG: hypothetical protein WD673_16015 [Alphaproteobacteria bacterium]